MRKSKVSFWFNRSVLCGFVAAAMAAVALAGPFAQGNLVVSQIGDGVTPLSSAANPVTLRAIDPDTGATLRTVALPTEPNGDHRRFVNSGSATSEGGLTRSADGQYLVLVGYDAAVGTPGIAATNVIAVNRTVARVDADGNVDTTTAVADGFNANNVRGAASADGTGFWVAGAGSGGTGGVRYILLGQTTSTQVSIDLTNMRRVDIYDGQLYCTAMSGTFHGVSMVGIGLPTTSGNTVTLLPGFPPGSGASNFDIYFADTQTLYVADDRSLANGGGLQKWGHDGEAWTLVTTFNNGLTTGLRGVVGTTDDAGNNVLYVVTSENTLNSVQRLIDDGSENPLFTFVAAAQTGTILRGIAWAPVSGDVRPGKPAVTATFPADGAVDARQPSDVDGSNPQDGFTAVGFQFDGDFAAVTEEDFLVSVKTNDDETPRDVILLGNDTSLTVIIDGSVPPVSRTTIVYAPTGQTFQFGYLPADVNGDGIASVPDVLALIDSLNGVTPLNDYSTDIDRSGVTGAPDVLRTIDLLNGAGAYTPYNLVALP